MNKKPTVTQLSLSKDYKFMYENFVISSQTTLYLLLENNNGQIDTLKFNFILYKYGYPNDEGLGVHPMTEFGLRSYGLFQVHNSEWMDQLDKRRPKTTWDVFKNYQHYIVTFKDVTLDVISKGFQEVTLTPDEVTELTIEEIANLTD